MSFTTPNVSSPRRDRPATPTTRTPRANSSPASKQMSSLLSPMMSTTTSLKSVPRTPTADSHANNRGNQQNTGDNSNSTRVVYCDHDSTIISTPKAAISMSPDDTFAQLCVLKRNGEDGTRFPVGKDSCVFGRDVEADIRVQLVGVSDRHCKIVIQDGKPFICALGGVTTVNGKVLESGEQNSAPLHHADIIGIKDRNFRFELLQAPIQRAVVSAPATPKRASVGQKFDGSKSVQPSHILRTQRVGTPTRGLASPLRIQSKPSLLDMTTPKANRSPLAQVASPLAAPPPRSSASASESESVPAAPSSLLSVPANNHFVHQDHNAMDFSLPPRSPEHSDMDLSNDTTVPIVVASALKKILWGPSTTDLSGLDDTSALQECMLSPSREEESDVEASPLRRSTRVKSATSSPSPKETTSACFPASPTLNAAPPLAFPSDHRPFPPVLNSPVRRFVGLDTTPAVSSPLRREVLRRSDSAESLDRSSILSSASSSLSFDLSSQNSATPVHKKMAIKADFKSELLGVASQKMELRSQTYPGNAPLVGSPFKKEIVQVASKFVSHPPLEKGLATPVKKEIAAAAAQFSQNYAPLPKGLSTPIRQEIVQTASSREQHMPLKKALSTPIRQAIVVTAQEIQKQRTHLPSDTFGSPLTTELVKTADELTTRHRRRVQGMPSPMKREIMSKASSITSSKRSLIMVDDVDHRSDAMDMGVPEEEVDADTPVHAAKKPVSEAMMKEIVLKATTFQELHQKRAVPSMLCCPSPLRRAIRKTVNARHLRPHTRKMTLPTSSSPSCAFSTSISDSSSNIIDDAVAKSEAQAVARDMAAVSVDSALTLLFDKADAATMEGDAMLMDVNVNVSEPLVQKEQTALAIADSDMVLDKPGDRGLDVDNGVCTILDVPAVVVVEAEMASAVPVAKRGRGRKTVAVAHVVAQLEDMTVVNTPETAETVAPTSDVSVSESNSAAMQVDAEEVTSRPTRSRRGHPAAASLLPVATLKKESDEKQEETLAETDVVSAPSKKTRGARSKKVTVVEVTAVDAPSAAEEEKEPARSKRGGRKAASVATATNEEKEVVATGRRGRRTASVKQETDVDTVVVVVEEPDVETLPLPRPSSRRRAAHVAPAKSVTPPPSSSSETVTKPTRSKSKKGHDATANANDAAAAPTPAPVVVPTSRSTRKRQVIEESVAASSSADSDAGVGVVDTDTSVGSAAATGGASASSKRRRTATSSSAVVVASAVGMEDVVESVADVVLPKRGRGKAAAAAGVALAIPPTSVKRSAATRSVKTDVVQDPQEVEVETKKTDRVTAKRGKAAAKAVSPQPEEKKEMEAEAASTSAAEIEVKAPRRGIRSKAPVTDEPVSSTPPPALKPKTSKSTPTKKTVKTTATTSSRGSKKIVVDNQEEVEEEEEPVVKMTKAAGTSKASKTTKTTRAVSAAKKEVMAEPVAGTRRRSTRGGAASTK